MLFYLFVIIKKNGFRKEKKNLFFQKKIKSFFFSFLFVFNFLNSFMFFFFFFFSFYIVVFKSFLLLKDFYFPISSSFGSKNINFKTNYKKKKNQTSCNNSILLMVQNSMRRFIIFLFMNLFF